MNFASLDGQLRSVPARLERDLRPIEPVFVEAGSHLSATVQHLGRLRDVFAAMAGRLEEGDTVAAIATLRDLAARIGALSDGTGASEALLDAMRTCATKLGTRITRLQKTIGEINVLAINAKVEAAHVTARDVDFTVFTLEIGRLAKLAGQSLGQLTDELSGLVGTMDGARTGLSSFARDHHQSLASVASRLGGGLAALAERNRASVDAIRAVGELSRNMAARVAETVAGLQIGDIARQRGEHVVEGLRTLVEVVESPDIASDQRELLVASVCRLQANQAGAAADELRRETQRIAANLAGLRSGIADLPRRCASAYAAATDTRASFLAELAHELHEAERLLQLYARARAGLDQVVAEVSTVVAGMVRHIEAINSIEADMRVMGLNATFKCARLGRDGRALSVIAQELRSYSNRTAEDGNAIMADLRGLMDAARQLDEHERLGQAAGTMEAELAAAVRTLDAVGGDLTRGLSSLAAGCDGATAALDRTQRLLEAHPEFAAALAECARTLEAAAGTAVADDRALDGIRKDVLDRLRGRYTMASERKIHEMLGGAGAADAPAVEEADDFLF